MSTPTREQPKVELSKGIAAGLVFLFIFGLLIGLPVILWILWAAALVVYLVATKDIRVDKAASDPRNQRPWRK